VYRSTGSSSRNRNADCTVGKQEAWLGLTVLYAYLLWSSNIEYASINRHYTAHGTAGSPRHNAGYRPLATGIVFCAGTGGLPGGHSMRVGGVLDVKKWAGHSPGRGNFSRV
jgi:hypothetical protein